MQNIKEFILSELEIFLLGQGYEKFHARQIFAWIYQKGIKGFSEMSDLPLALRKMLKENFSFFDLTLKHCLDSQDKTQKLLFLLKDGNIIEAVTIPSVGRTTACISTQAGCKFACKFCASGLSGFQRNLTAAEMLDEVLCLKKHAPEQKLTHIVFMGGGEPLDNYPALIQAVRAINARWGMCLGARKITVSTCGIVPGIERLAQEGLQIELSISLHAADERTRSQLMPVNQKYPLKVLLKACRDYILKTNRQLTFEYILIQGINSHLQNAQNLSKILHGLNAKVNLIPCSYVAEIGLQPPSKLEILLFRDYLLKHGITVTLRRSRGEDIQAACGQLRLKHV